MNELRAVVNELGGEQTLGRALSNDHDMREAIREGFRPAVLEELMRASGLTLKELADSLDLSLRSLQRRRRSGRLARYESDGSTGWPALWQLPTSILATRNAPFAGSSDPITYWVAWRLSQLLTPSWEPGRLKTFSDALPMAESVDSGLPGLAQKVCASSF